MSDRDVLDVLRDMRNTIDYARSAGVSPAYPDASIRAVLGRAADEVERLRDDLRIAESVNHQCESVDAAIARVVALADGLSRAEFRQTIVDGHTVEFAEGWDAACENIRRALDGPLEVIEGPTTRR